MIFVTYVFQKLTSSVRNLQMSIEKKKGTEKNQTLSNKFNNTVRKMKF